MKATSFIKERKQLDTPPLLFHLSQMLLTCKEIIIAFSPFRIAIDFLLPTVTRLHVHEEIEV